MQKPKYQKLSKNKKACTILSECVEQGFSDKQIQQRLIQECGYKWAVETISRHRRSMKTSDELTDADKYDVSVLTMPPPGLSEHEKMQWFVDQFKKTNMFVTIKRQFEPDEVCVYLDNFGSLCCQFEDIVVSEFMQIDDFLKHRILIDRQLILARTIGREVAALNEWFAKNPPQEGEDKDTIRSRLAQQRQVNDKYKELKGVQDRYDALVKERQKIHTSLAATRKDRLDELRGGKETFLDLVAQLQHSQEERTRQGHLAELTKLASEDVKKEFRKPIEFPDGSVDPIIMDSDTDFGEEPDE